jgi:hypothetical protein
MIFISVFALGLGLMRAAWADAPESAKSALGGAIIGVVLGAVGTLAWLSFTPEEEEEEKPSHRKASKTKEWPK